VFVCLVGLLSLPSRGTAAATQYQNWPMFLQNPGRSGATVDPLLSVSRSSDLMVKWAFDTGGPVATSVSIVGTTAYVGSWTGYEYAVNTTTGKKIWRSPNLGITTAPNCDPAKNGITSSADVYNGVLYVGGGGPYWYALKASTGAILWRIFTGSNTPTSGHYNWSSPLIYRGYAYIGIASNCDEPLVQGHLMQVSLATHKLVHNYNFVPDGEVGGGVWTSPTLDSSTNTIFVTTATLNDYTQTQSQAIVALNASNLAYKGSWQLPFDAAVSDSDWGTTPTLTTDSQGARLVSAANKNGILYTWLRSDLEQGKIDTHAPLWQYHVAIGGPSPTEGQGTIASGAFAHGVLYYAGGEQVLNGHGSGGTISAHNPGTGATLWTRQTQGPIFGAPAYVNGMVAYGEGDTFEVVNAANGHLLYSYQLSAPIYGAVSVARSQFYVGDTNSKVYAFGLPATLPAPPPPDRHCPKTLDPSDATAGAVTCQDIGRPGVADSEKTSGGVLTVKASGAGIKGSSDQFRLISADVTDASQSSVRIVAQGTQNSQAQAGLMARQSNSPTAPLYAVLAYPNDSTQGKPKADLILWYRTAWGGSPVELTNLYPATKPLYVMIQRVGNVFSAGVSTDGVHYSLIPGSTAYVDLPSTTLEGLAVDSGSPTHASTASFADLDIGARITAAMRPKGPANPCPKRWTCTDIGSPNPVGDSTSSSPTSFTLDGTGTDIGPTTDTDNSSDSFHYLYRSVSGNKTISARVITQAGTTPTAQEGIMMRANSSPTAPYYAVLFNPRGSATVSWRYHDGLADPTGTIAMPSTKSPAYVEITRYQETRLGSPNIFFTAETSPNGKKWSPVLGSTQAIPMGKTYLAGMAADAGSPEVIPAPVVFKAVTLKVASKLPAGICPRTFTCLDIGNEIAPGNQIFVPQEPDNPSSTLGVWTIQASGSDIYSTYDNFRYIFQSFPYKPAVFDHGDGTIGARVVSQTNPNHTGWIKTGVMIRGLNGANPKAPYYGVFVTTGNGVLVQWRPTEGAETSQVLAPGAGSSALRPVTPIYVLAERYTDPSTGVVYYAAFTSPNGVDWTWIHGSTVALALTGRLTGGIATDSYDTTKYSVATVEDLAQLPEASPPPGLGPDREQQ
jgi:hypothetical protein